MSGLLRDQSIDMDLQYTDNPLSTNLSNTKNQKHPYFHFAQCNQFLNNNSFDRVSVDTFQLFLGSFPLTNSWSKSHSAFLCCWPLKWRIWSLSIKELNDLSVRKSNTRFCRSLFQMLICKVFLQLCQLKLNLTRAQLFCCFPMQ